MTNVMQVKNKLPVIAAILALPVNVIAGPCVLPQIINPAAHTCVKAVTKAGTVGLANSGVARTDVFEVTCAVGAKSLTVAILDTDIPKRSAQLSIQIIKPEISASIPVNDNIDDSKYSNLVKLNGAAGIYTVLVNKSEYFGTDLANKGAENYIALFSCRNSANSQVGTSVVSTQ